MAPRDLVRLLVDKGVLTDQRVAEAMATVPRELFVPQDRRDEAYTDTVLVTKWDDAGVAISSASQPAMVAIMLEQLRVEPGHSVLEIGAGTGYNAALLGRLAARVVTFDIDEDIARQARDRLTDVENVEVRVGDGWAGAPDHAPYDRIELTIGTSDVSAAWRDQLADGGLLVLPLWLRVGVQLSVAFRRDGDVLRGESVRDCGFQRLRGPHSGPEGFVAVGGGDFVVLDDASDAAPLCELLSRPPREERAPFIDPAVFARMALDEPRTLAVSDLSGALRPGLYDTGGAVVIDNERMLTYGSPAARDRLIYGLGTARPLDRSRLRVTASFGTPPPPPQGWRFVRRSCVVDVAEG
jgi:protein-L-isoaspartate(D-aspartate) O-methyltransferase